MYRVFFDVQTECSANIGLNVFSILKFIELLFKIEFFFLSHKESQLLIR
jgi:hypothetical protein